MKNLQRIPDANFRNKLKIYFPAAFENDLLDINNEKIVSCGFLNLNGLNILDLRGIEWFVNLKYLWCPKNQLTTLHNLPKRLRELDCHNNRLTTLSKLPDTLEYLYCSNNRLTSLPILPDRLEYLECDNNRLTTLPKLPSTLEYLGCHDNNFTNNENVFMESNNNVIVKQNNKYFFDL